MSLLAVDIGSSACKAVVFANSGELLASHSAAYAPDFPRPGFVEIDPNYFWQAVCVTTQQATKNITDPVRALCLSSHGETLIPVDARGEAIGAAILNQDSRASEEAMWIENTLGRKSLFEITGQVAQPAYPIAKILWLRKYDPTLFTATARFVSVTDFVLLRLGLPPYIDHSLASRFLAFDIRRRCWAEEILAAAELSKERLPIPVPASTIAGKLNASAASQLGLRAGTPVVVGGHDQPCGALGTGILGPGPVLDSIGTYESVLAASDAPCLTDAALAASLNTYCHVVPDKFVTLAYFPSGIMVKWFHDLLYKGGAEGHAANGNREAAEAEHYSFLESQAPAGPTGLCVTPHLIGTGTPDFDPEARAVIAGLNPATGRTHIYKGILEGVACELAQITGLLEEAVGDFQDIRVIGGGTRSALGLRLRAAMTGKRLHTMRCQESVCLGGAILAGVAAGEFRSIRQAVEQMVQESATLWPEPAVAAAYIRQIQRYRGLRSALAQAQNT